MAVSSRIFSYINAWAPNQMKRFDDYFGSRAYADAAWDKL
jgi:hypothetical protein